MVNSPPIAKLQMKLSPHWRNAACDGQPLLLLTHTKHTKFPQLQKSICNPPLQLILHAHPPPTMARQAPQSSASPIPIVDFSPFPHGPLEAKQQAAHLIDSAFRSLGFVYLSNHGIPPEKVSSCFTHSKAFFSLPSSTKLLAPHPPGGAHHRGYSPPGLEHVTQHTYDKDSIAASRETPDYKESFESGNPNDASQPNIWLPEEELPGFRACMEEFFELCAGLVHRVLDALSLALGVPEPGLAKTHDEALFQLRLLRYPAIEAAQLREGRRNRINAHSDFGTLTLLFQDGVGGLEIEDPNHPGRFNRVGAVENAVLLNVGDLMARWSNDRWRSTVHRVGLPPPKTMRIPGPGVNTEGQRSEGKVVELEEEEGAVVPERYSIPFFATANMDTVVEALPGTWSEDNPKKYEAVTAWEYVQKRMAALYDE